MTVQVDKLVVAGALLEPLHHAQHEAGDHARVRQRRAGSVVDVQVKRHRSFVTAADAAADAY